MSEMESFKAGRESRADVVSRAGRSSHYGDVVQRLVDAAFYRETHRAEPIQSAQDETEPDGGDE